MGLRSNKPDCLILESKGIKEELTIVCLRIGLASKKVWTSTENVGPDLGVFRLLAMESGAPACKGELEFAVMFDAVFRHIVEAMLPFFKFNSIMRA